jgi:hypothetical protein
MTKLMGLANKSTIKMQSVTIIMNKLILKLMKTNKMVDVKHVKNHKLLVLVYFVNK